MKRRYYAGQDAMLPMPDGLSEYRGGGRGGYDPGAACAPAFGQNRCEYGRSCKDVTIGFGSANILAGASGQVAALPQRCFCLERLIVPSSIAQFFVITAFNIGDLPQLSGGNPVPAEVFTQDAEDVVTFGDCVFPGMNVILSVTNIDNETHTFFAAMIGSSRSPS